MKAADTQHEDENPAAQSGVQRKAAPFPPPTQEQQIKQLTERVRKQIEQLNIYKQTIVILNEMVGRLKSENSLVIIFVVELLQDKVTIALGQQIVQTTHDILEDATINEITDKVEAMRRIIRRLPDIRNLYLPYFMQDAQLYQDLELLTRPPPKKPEPTDPSPS